MNRAALEDMRAALKTRLLHRQQTGRETTADLGDLALLLDALLAPEPPRPVDYARDPQPPPALEDAAYDALAVVPPMLGGPAPGAAGSAIALSIPFMRAERDASRAATRPVALWETA